MRVPESTSQVPQQPNEPPVAGATPDSPAAMEGPDPRTFRKQPVSFVRRGGRITESQERAWDELGPRFLINLPRGYAATSIAEDAVCNPVEIYGRTAPLTVEIGSGQGHAIVHAATAHPERDFLAVEVFKGGLARTMIRADWAGIQNLRMIEANAPEVLERALPEGSVDELWVFFPDPWAKTKHHKRRLISPAFTEIAGRALREGGTLRLATDWQEYADHMRDVLDSAPQFERAFSGEWAPRYDGRVLTAFEEKGIKKGREIRDLTYRRVV